MCSERLQSLAIVLPPPSSSLREAVVEPLAGVVSFVAGVAQLAYMPWHPLVRIAVFACFSAIGVFLLVRYARERIDAVEAAAQPDSTGAPPLWRASDLADVQLVTIVTEGSGHVARAELHGDRRVRAEPLPLSRHQALSYLHREGGYWHLDGDELTVAASHRGLTLRPTMMSGIWAGLEVNGNGPERLLAAIIDPRPLPPGQPWVALKLGESGQRRMLVAEDSGRLRETDLITRQLVREGSWAVGEKLHVDFGDGWSLLAEPTPPGFLLGAECALGQPREDFVIVRIRPEP